MRKRVAILLCMSLIVTLLAACGNSGTTGNASTQGSQNSEVLGDETEQPSTDNLDTEEPSTDNTEEKEKELTKSGQAYQDAKQLAVDRYAVKKDGKYGLVKFDGSEIIPLKYDSYAMVATNEIEFVSGEKATVYNLNTGKVILEYNKHEAVGNAVIDEWKVVESFGKATYTVYPISWDYEDEVPDKFVEYRNGMMCESIFVLINYSSEGTGGASTAWKVTYKNVSTGKVLYTGYTTFADAEQTTMTHAFSKNLDEAEAIVQTRDGKLVVVKPTGTQTHDWSNISVYGDGSYSDGWAKWFDFGRVVLFHTATGEFVEVPLGQDVYYYNYQDGNGKCFALSLSYDSNRFEIYSGKDVLEFTCDELVFSNDKYYVKRDFGYCYYTDFNGNLLLIAMTYGEFINGKAMIQDGDWFYYMNENFEKISEKVFYSGYTLHDTGVIKDSDGACYLVDLR